MVEDAGGSDVTQTFTLRLGTPPTSPVTITMAAVAVEPAQVTGRPWTDPDITVTQSVVLNATNYAAGEDVTITLSDDDDAEDDVARINYTVTQPGGAMEYDGFTISSTTVNISDPETPVVLFRDPELRRLMRALLVGTWMTAVVMRPCICGCRIARAER